jgi:hypothetical protein
MGIGTRHTNHKESDDDKDGSGTSTSRRNGKNNCKGDGNSSSSSVKHSQSSIGGMSKKTAATKTTIGSSDENDRFMRTLAEVATPR